ncbi:MAG: CPBP family intramembrane glutamic endopeptidase [Schlesneria sp.]
MTRSIAFAIVILSLIETRYRMGISYTLLALVGVVSILSLDPGSSVALGFNPRPIQGWGYWFRLALWFALLIGLVAIASWFVLKVNGWKVPIYKTSPSIDMLVFMCIDAPVSEEILFRSLLTLAILPALGEWGTIVAGGFLFSLLHVLHGNPGPDNQIAGFMLGWTFIKSKTILVPLAMHAGGNLIALGFQVAAWYFY